MAPRPWADLPQDTWIIGRLPAFYAAQDAGTLAAFWNQTYKDWFDIWDKDKDTEFQDSRREQLHNRFYNAKKPKLGKREKKKQGKKRPPRAHEVYSQLYYKTDGLDEQVQVELAGQNDRKRKSLPAINKVSKRAYENADEARKEAVREEIKRRKEAEAATTEGNHTPDSYNEAIQALPTIASKFLKEQGAFTGWCFRLIAGGPHPSLGGDLDSFTLDIGKDNEGKRFNQVRNVNSQQEEFLGWLDGVFPHDVRQSRALSGNALLEAIPQTSGSPPSSPPRRQPSPSADDSEDDVPRKPANALEFSRLYRMDEEAEEEELEVGMNTLQNNRAADESHPPSSSAPDGSQTTPSASLPSASAPPGSQSASSPSSSAPQADGSQPTPAASSPSSAAPNDSAAAEITTAGPARTVAAPPTESSPSPLAPDNPLPAQTAATPLTASSPPSPEPDHPLPDQTTAAPPTSTSLSSLSPNVSGSASVQTTAAAPASPPSPRAPDNSTSAHGTTTPHAGVNERGQASNGPGTRVPQDNASDTPLSVAVTSTLDVQTSRRVRKPAKTRDLTTVAGDVIELRPTKRKATSTNRYVTYILNLCELLMDSCSE
ncbi:hypothetical protein BDN72DRAFT_906026 [Pluteus cervinus]|uniref:Uncharacterized protein n=1 Tax=Pluteus cervinus TaxID=181527 RepID=A0ACD3A131_9AGAR|nr:hypothetical protein BDN72DRAFT_906026 [Pluteus cervinus]